LTASAKHPKLPKLPHPKLPKLPKLDLTCPVLEPHEAPGSSRRPLPTPASQSSGAVRRCSLTWEQPRRRRRLGVRTELRRRARASADEDLTPRDGQGFRPPTPKAPGHLSYPLRRNSGPSSRNARARYRGPMPVSAQRRCRARVRVAGARGNSVQPENGGPALDGVLILGPHSDGASERLGPTRPTGRPERGIDFTLGDPSHWGTCPGTRMTGFGRIASLGRRSSATGVVYITCRADPKRRGRETTRPFRSSSLCHGVFSVRRPRAGHPSQRADGGREEGL
jgi:hypothetical protein